MQPAEGLSPLPGPGELLGLGNQPTLMILIHRPMAPVQVGEAFEKNRTYSELKLIASDPDDRYAFKVTNYTALDGLLSKLQENIIQMEGESSAEQSP